MKWGQNEKENIKGFQKAKEINVLWFISKRYPWTRLTQKGLNSNTGSEREAIHENLLLSDHWDIILCTTETTANKSAVKTNIVISSAAVSCHFSENQRDPPPPHLHPALLVWVQREPTHNSVLDSFRESILYHTRLHHSLKILCCHNVFY